MEVVPRQSFIETFTNQLSLTRILVWGVMGFLGLGIGFLIILEERSYALALAMAVPLALLFLTRPFVGVILWLLTLPFVNALPNPQVMYWALHRILIIMTLGLVVVQYLVKADKNPLVRLGPPELMMGILAGLVPITIILSQTDTRMPLIQYTDRILIPFCMYLIIRLITLDKVELRRLQWTAFFIAASQAIIGFLSWFAPSVLPHEWLFLAGLHTSGSLENPNVYAAMLFFCAAIILHAALSRPPGLIRWLFLAAFVSSLLCIFLSMERAAWLALAVFVLGLLFVYPKPTLWMIAVCSIVMLVLGAGILSAQFTRAAARIGEQNQINARIVVTDAMLQMFQEKPVLGWGYNTLNNFIEQYYRQVGSANISRTFTTSHNSYLTILTELGLVGLLLYLFPTVWWLWQTLRVYRWVPRKMFSSWSLVSVLWLALLANFVISNFMDMRFFPIGLTVWWLMLGLIANTIYPYTKSAKIGIN